MFTIVFGTFFVVFICMSVRALHHLFCLVVLVYVLCVLCIHFVIVFSNLFCAVFLCMFVMFHNMLLIIVLLVTSPNFNCFDYLWLFLCGRRPFLFLSDAGGNPLFVVCRFCLYCVLYCFPGTLYYSIYLSCQNKVSAFRNC